ncbi:MAG: iron-siderophore ABC transporter substrate-binding protein [Cyanobacteria bacterium J06649_4]
MRGNSKINRAFHSGQTWVNSAQHRASSYLYQPLNRQRRFVVLAGAAAFVTACRQRPPEIAEPAGKVAAGARIIQHGLGETIVPDNPSRVVVWGYAMVEAVVALGVQPVGIPGIILEEATYFDLDKEAIANISETGEPNLEAIAALNPDLILTTQSLGANSYTLFSQIAPTVAFDIDERVEWRGLTRLCAEALNKQSAAEKLSADYDAKLAQLKSELSQPPEAIETSVVIFLPNEIRAMGDNSFPGSILSDVGLSRPPSQMGKADLRNISIEALDQIDGDVMFVLTPQSNTALADRMRAEIESVQANPLWQQLSAVQNGSVYDVEQYWVFGNYIAADLVLEDLMVHLTETI